MSVKLTINPADIADGLKRLLEPGQVTELRALNYTRPGSNYSCTMSGYFSDFDAMANEAAKLSTCCTGVYFIPNPVNPDLLARVCNRVKQAGKGDATTADRDIIRRCRLLIDCDPQRASGISATDAERKLAFEKAGAVRDFLRLEGWPDPVEADSGNGAHLMYRIDEPTEDGGLVKGCLEALAARFNEDSVHIDTTVFNPARIWKLYGTLARKGENVPNRPHRLAALLSVPDMLEVVTTDQLTALAGTLTPVEKPAQRHIHGEFDLERWIDKHLAETSHKRTAEGDVWTIEVCPFNPEHNRGEAFVIRRTDGTIGAGCKHDSCKWSWRELRAKLEPDRHAGKPGNASGTERPLTDLGNAERLIDAYGADLRYDRNRGAWLVWTAKRWEYDSTGEVNRLAMKVVRSLYKQLREADSDRAKDLLAHIKRSESAPRLAAIVDVARDLPGVSVKTENLDHDPWLLNCLNGTVDLRTGELRPHARGDLITKLAPVEYDPGAQCPRWTRFLEEVFQGDSEIIGFAKRMAGYCLTGSTREESVFMLTGKGQNGKTKLVEALRAVMGDYGANTPFMTFIERRDANTADLAALTGKRLVTASEGEDTQSFNESLLKELTGGDQVTCRHLYRDFFTYTPSFKIVFSTNEVPRIRSQNYAMKRRVKLIPFRQRFYDPEDGRGPVKDDRLLEKLQAEKNGILAWAVAGCLEWQRIGLATPQVIRQEVERLFESQDPLAEFIESECEIRPGGEIAVSEMWQAYHLWCDETNSPTTSAEASRKETGSTRRKARGEPVTSLESRSIVAQVAMKWAFWKTLP